MAKATVSDFLRHLTGVIDAETEAAHSDRHLVERFLAEREEAVFLALLRRHGAMVYRVCWRVLQQTEEAEDAFQATFLVLAQKLRTVRKLESLGSWLHGVALRVALKARGKAAKRRLHQQQAAVALAVMPDDLSWAELRTVLDVELARLPERWRLPLILCYLEDHTQDQAAGKLGWSRSTFRRRLEAGRAALGRRLRRRGVVWPAAFSAALLADCVGAALPANRLGDTLAAVSQLLAGKPVASGLVSAKVAAQTEGVLKAMFFKKLKIATALLLSISLLLLGAGGFIYQALPAAAIEDAHLDPPAPDVKPKHGDNKKQPEQAKPITVQVVHAKQGVLEAKATSAATLASSESVQVYPRVPGLLQKLYVDIGDKVKKGQLLAEVDAPELFKDVDQANSVLDLAKAKVMQQEALVDTAKGELRVADAGVAQHEAELESAKKLLSLREKEFARFKELQKTGAVSATLIDEQQDKLGAAQAKVSSARSAIDTALAEKALKQNRIQLAQAGLKIEMIQLQGARIGVEKAQILAGFTHVAAPFDGVVTKRNFNIGSLLSSKNPEPILTITRTDLLRLIVPVAENDAVLVQIGTPVDLDLPALKQKLAGLKVSRFSPTIDPKTATMQLEVDIPNPTGKLLPGMFGTATITLAKSKANSLIIPNSCIAAVAAGDVAAVFVVRNGKACLTKIQRGIQQAASVEVLAGLNPDDVVVLNPQGIKDGTPVTVKKAK